MMRVLRALSNWLFNTHGSARTLALIRMGIVCNAWARWGDDHVIYRNLDPEVVAVGLLFFVSSTATFFGALTRVSSAIFAATTWYFVYVQGHMRGFEPYTHHHTTLLAWAALLLALSPSGRSLSFDRYLQLKRADRAGTSPPSEIANLWAQRLMVVQLSSVYFWGAVDKCHWAFLDGSRMSHILMYYYTGPTELADLSRLLPGAMTFVAGATVVLEFALAFGLFFRRGRSILVLSGFFLHGVFYFSLSVFTFTTTMWVLYLAVFDSNDVDALLARLLLLPADPEIVPESPS